MARNPFSRRYRPAWALAALVLLAVMTLTVPPIRTLAADLLAVFRVERIAFAPVDVESLPEEERLEDLAPEIERMFGDTLAVVQESEPVEITVTEVRERAPFTVRLPDMEEAVLHEWTAPMHVAIEIDVPRLQGLFDELGYEDVVLPKGLDGKTLEADFAGTLTSHYGTCESEQAGGDCLTFVQTASPAASVPEGLDVEQLGRIYLELLGTPADEAARLSREIDWTTTLVLPFPHHVNLTHETLSVDGVEGTLIRSESAHRPAPEYLITWIKDGVMYALVGKSDYSEALELIDSLQ